MLLLCYFHLQQHRDDERMSGKILWGEGLFLRPQHFQQQDQYHEERLHRTAALLHPYAWGIGALQVDRDALANDTLRLLELALRFPDGELYSAPGGDELPDAIDLGQLPQSVQTVTYHAALPGFKPYGANFSGRKPDGADGADAANAARFRQLDRDTPDLYTQAASAQLTYLRKTVRLVSDAEPLDAYVHVPVLRLRRAATGGFELDGSFVPPCLTIKSAPLLFLQLRRLLDALQAKVSALYGHHREPSRHVIEFRSGDMSSFWLLHTASTACATLAHYFHHPSLHPERLYEQLLSLAGSLMTFSKSWTLADLPPYQHADPGPAFATLHQIIRELLDTVISSKYFAIALSNERPSYHLGALDSGKINGQTTLYLGVAADMPALQLVEIVPLRFKIGAPEDVDKLVLSAMPGVRLVHAPQVPSAVPVRPDTYYFVLENRGVLYESMLKAQAISIYVPNGIRDLKLELIGIAA
jgi:type VI secretion system protein ImpJ